MFIKLLIVKIKALIRVAKIILWRELLNNKRKIIKAKKWVLKKAINQFHKENKSCNLNNKKS